MKNRYIKNLIYVLFLLGHWGCHEKKEITSKFVISLKDCIKSKEYFSFDHLAQNLTLIELKQSKGKFISGVNKIIVTHDTHIFLLNGQTAIYDYDENGNLHNVIGKIGKGPGEFMEATDFCLSKDESLVHVLSRYYIHTFKRSGEFVGKIDITNYRKDDYLPEYIEEDGGDGFYLWDSNPSKVSDFDSPFYCLWHINKKSKVLGRFFERTEFVFELPRFTKSFDGGYWIRPLEGSWCLFKISSNELVNEASIDFGGKSLPKNYFSRFQDSPYQNLDKWVNSDYYKMPSNFYDNSNYLIFTYGGPNGITCDCLYNKLSSNIISKRRNSNNPEILFADSTYFYSYYDPSSADVNEMDSVFRTLIQKEQNLFDKNFIFKFKLNEN